MMNIATWDTILALFWVIYPPVEVSGVGADFADLFKNLLLSGIKKSHEITRHYAQLFMAL